MPKLLALNSPYIDVHSHDPIPSPHIGLQSFFIQEINIEDTSFSNCSIGIHPWHILKTDIPKSLASLDLLAKLPMIKAVGECGLDRSISVDFDLQKRIFLSHLSIAELQNKPMIVHNVRAFADFLSILKTHKPNIPIIFHAFNGNSDILKKLLPFNVYFSFGSNLFHEMSKESRIIKQIPINRIFLETDDWKGSIEDIYKIAAKKMEISLVELRRNINYNYKILFL